MIIPCQSEEERIWEEKSQKLEELAENIGRRIKLLLKRKCLTITYYNEDPEMIELYGWAYIIAQRVGQWVESLKIFAAIHPFIWSTKLYVRKMKIDMEGDRIRNEAVKLLAELDEAIKNWENLIFSE